MRQSRIYYFCPDFRELSRRQNDVPTRGHSERDCLDAAVLHSRRDFDAAGLKIRQKLPTLSKRSLEKKDIIVFPEPFLAYFTDSHNPSKARLRLNRIYAKSRHKYYINELSKRPSASHL